MVSSLEELHCNIAATAFKCTQFLESQEKKFHKPTNVPNCGDWPEPWKLSSTKFFQNTIYTDTRTLFPCNACKCQSASLENLALYGIHVHQPILLDRQAMTSDSTKNNCTNVDITNTTTCGQTANDSRQLRESWKHLNSIFWPL